MKKHAAALFLVLAAGLASATGVRMRHTVTLQPGWNAFYLPITLDATADEAFADWPVETVGYYDQNAFMNTQQFTTSAADSTLGAIDVGMKMWKRNDPGHSSFQAVVANGVYVAVNTNRTAFVAELYGEPAAYRVSWHVSDGVTAPLNYVGVSSSGSAPLTAEGYFSGLATGWSARYRIKGVPTATVPALEDIARNPELPNGGAVAMDAATVSDWSGVLNVSPAHGLSLGTNLSVSAVVVRNDAATNRLVRVSLREGEWADGVLHLPVPTVMYLDPVRHDEWQASLRAAPYVCELAPGETLRLRLAVDRERELLAPVAGTEYGGVVDVEDVSAETPSGFRTSVPFSAQADGGEFRRTQWPKGLWSASVTLDRVGRMIDEKAGDVTYEGKVTEAEYTTYVVTTNDVTGTVATNRETVVIAVTNQVPVLATAPVPVVQPMTVRLLVHVDAAGAMNLMQRARFGGRRLTAAVLPTDAPVLPGSGTFGETANVAWTVGASSKVNPFRHAKHPDHDGLNADFDGPAPDGDDFSNYVATVKPELFSIANSLTLTWAASTAAAWSPEETLSGTCTWSLEGLRREGRIRMSGTFTMKRLTSADLAELKEEL
ncbi:MAG: hypothetical protein ACI4RD_01390 [Kiritimatiellia bacterium]